MIEKEKMELCNQLLQDYFGVEFDEKGHTPIIENESEMKLNFILAVLTYIIEEEYDDSTLRVGLLPKENGVYFTIFLDLK